MAPKEKLPIKDMQPGETAVFHWKTYGYADYKKMYAYVANRLQFLRKNSRATYSMLSLPGEKVLVKRHT